MAQVYKVILFVLVAEVLHAGASSRSAEVKVIPQDVTSGVHVMVMCEVHIPDSDDMPDYISILWHQELSRRLQRSVQDDQGKPNDLIWTPQNSVGHFNIPGSDVRFLNPEKGVYQLMAIFPATHCFNGLIPCYASHNNERFSSKASYLRVKARPELDIKINALSNNKVNVSCVAKGALDPMDRINIFANNAKGSYDRKKENCAFTETVTFVVEREKDQLLSCEATDELGGKLHSKFIPIPRSPEATGGSNKISIWSWLIFLALLINMI